MKKLLSKAWKFLDGKKTAIGTVLLVVANHLPQGKPAQVALSILGQVLGATGVAHKFKKKELPSGLSQLKKMVGKK